MGGSLHVAVQIRCCRCMAGCEFDSRKACLSSHVPAPLPPPQKKTAFSPLPPTNTTNDGGTSQYLAVGSYDQTLRLLNPLTWEVAFDLGRHRAPAWGEEGAGGPLCIRWVDLGVESSLSSSNASHHQFLEVDRILESGTPSLHIYIYSHTHIHIYIHACTHQRLHIYSHTHIYILTRTYMHTPATLSAARKKRPGQDSSRGCPRPCPKSSPTRAGPTPSKRAWVYRTIDSGCGCVAVCV